MGGGIGTGLEQVSIGDVDVAYREPDISISKLFEDGPSEANKISTIERIAHQCRFIMNHPETWRKQAENVLNFFNNETGRNDQLEDTYIGLIRVAILKDTEAKDYLSYDYTYRLYLTHKEGHGLTIDANLSPFLRSTDIENYEKSLKK